MDLNNGASADADPALVSDQAASRLAPTGFDPLRGYIPFSVRAHLSDAIADPASVLPRLRGDNWLEEINHWKDRAALEIVMREVALSPSFASAIEARRAETLGSVHESAAPQEGAQHKGQSSDQS